MPDQAAAETARVDRALTRYQAVLDLPEDLKETNSVQYALRKAYKAAQAIEGHPYRALGPKHHVSISAYNAVLQVQDNAYAYMINPKPEGMIDPTAALGWYAAKLQPRNDFLNSLASLGKTTAKLEKAWNKFCEKEKVTAIKKAQTA